MNVGVKYRCIYPSCYEHDPNGLNGPKWKLGNYGFFGLGTVYQEYCYHQFRIGHSTVEEQKDFASRCFDVISNNFFIDNFKSSTELINHKDFEESKFDYQNSSIELYDPDHLKHFKKINWS